MYFCVGFSKTGFFKKKLIHIIIIQLITKTTILLRENLEL